MADESIGPRDVVIETELGHYGFGVDSQLAELRRLVEQEGGTKMSEQPGCYSVSARIEEALGRRDPGRGRQWGHVTAVSGPLIRAAVPDIRMGELVEIERAGQEPLPAEVVGFDDRGAQLMPLGEMAGVAIKAKVVSAGTQMLVPTGDQVRGRVLDALGRPLDDGPALTADWPLMQESPAA